MKIPRNRPRHFIQDPYLLTIINVLKSHSKTCKNSVEQCLKITWGSVVKYAVLVLCNWGSQWPRGLGNELSLLALERWDRRFESHWRHGCLCVFILCAGSGLATGWSPVQGVLLTLYKIKKLKKRQRSNQKKDCSTIDRWYYSIISLFTFLWFRKVDSNSEKQVRWRMLSRIFEDNTKEQTLTWE
jgi:hypothetical protein